MAAKLGQSMENPIPPPGLFVIYIVLRRPPLSSWPSE